jgi:hypothetical protein
MGLLIRTLLWLLVFAVPVQGIAATAMAICGLNHHTGSAAAQVQRGAPISHTHNDSAAAPEHQHHQPVAEAATDEAAPVASSQVGDASGHKCSACASCCTAGATPSSVPALPTPVSAPTVFSAVVPDVGGFATDGPDRPPRHVVA